MVAANTDSRRTAFTVSVDARAGVTTGISAADRARTIQAMIDPATEPADLSRPGHIFPLRYREGGVLKRAGHTEAAVDLARLAGLYPAGVLCETVNEDGTMARLPDLERVRPRARPEDDLDRRPDRAPPTSTRCSSRRSRRRTSRRVTASSARSPTRASWTRRTHVALVTGDLGDGAGVLTRVHSECLTGDVFGSLRCDCGEQLDRAMELIGREGRGVILYIRGHEGSRDRDHPQAPGVRAPGSWP